MTSRDKAEKELAARRKRLQADIKRFERRGRTARNRSSARSRRPARASSASSASAAPASSARSARPARTSRAQADLLGARVENIVQTGITRGTQVATKVQERVASVA